MPHDDHDEAPKSAPRKLPVLGNERPLSLIEAAHLAYGGRARSSKDIGTVVRVKNAETLVSAVVLFAHEDDFDLCLEDGSLVHAKREQCETLAPPYAQSVSVLLQEIKAFASLDELERVRFRSGTRIDHGMIAEKCKYGALVMRDDGSLQGVSFRDLNPVP